MDLIDAIDLMSTRRRPDVIELTAKDIHHCELAMWFKYRNVKLVTYDARKQQFAEGLKQSIRDWLSACGYRLMAENSKLPGGQTIDAIIKREGFQLLDVHACSKKTFKRLVKHGLDESHIAMLHERMQQTATLSKRGNAVDSSLTVLVDRDSFDVFTITTTNNPLHLEVVNQQLRDVMLAESAPPANKSFRCNWCDYKQFCERNELAVVSCRTCANASIEGGEIVCDFGSKVCRNHLYHPQLMHFAGYDMEGADQQNMIIKYRNFANVTEGGARMDGHPSMTSRELAMAAGAGDLQEDEVFTGLMAQFDGRLLAARKEP